MNEKIKKVLIGLILLIVVCLIILTIYVFIGNNKNNDKTENKTRNSMLDAYYLLNTEVINENILSYRYSAIANNEISYSDFRKNYLLKNIVDNLESISSVGCNDDSNINSLYDKDGLEYPSYCDKDTSSIDCVEEYAKEFGLTVEEINKIDKDVWPEIPGGGGSFCNYMYDANVFKEAYEDIYKEIFDTSFSIYFSNDLNGATSAYIYDKNIDKIIIDGYGGTAGFDERVIIEEKEENNIYKVKFVEGHFIPGGKWMTLDIDSNEEISDKKEASEVIRRNQDNLPKYEVEFEKVEIGYKYKGIKKVD